MRLEITECQRCGYSAEGLRTGTCPECGNDLHLTWKEIDGTQADLPTRRRVDRVLRPGCIVFAVLGLLATGLVVLGRLRLAPP